MKFWLLPSHWIQLGWDCTSTGKGCVLSFHWTNRSENNDVRINPYILNHPKWKPSIRMETIPQPALHTAPLCTAPSRAFSIYSVFSSYSVQAGGTTQVKDVCALLHLHLLWVWEVVSGVYLVCYIFSLALGFLVIVFVAMCVYTRKRKQKKCTLPYRQDRDDLMCITSQLLPANPALLMK